MACDKSTLDEIDLTISSGDEEANYDEEYDEDDDDSYEGRTYFDFETEGTLPNLTIKTFLKDCLQHPKILFHKEFHFFLSYLKELSSLQMILPSNSPFSENHEDNLFCVDRCDKKWLAKLKQRIYPDKDNEYNEESEDEYDDNYHWASISPVKRKSDLGLVIFKWEPQPMAVSLLEAYIAYGRSLLTDRETDDEMNDNTKKRKGSPDIDDADDYVFDFLSLFEVEHNMDVESRYKDALDAANERKLSNKIEPPRNDLLYLFRNQPRTIKFPFYSSKPKPNKSGNSQDSSTSCSDDDSSSDSDSSSSSTSCDSSSGSEYKGYYYIKGHRKRRQKRKDSPTKLVQIFSNEPTRSVNGMRMRKRTQTIRLNGSAKKAYVPIDIRINVERLPYPVPKDLAAKLVAKAKGEVAVVTAAAAVIVETQNEMVMSTPIPTTSTTPPSQLPEIQEVMEIEEIIILDSPPQQSPTPPPEVNSVENVEEEMEDDVVIFEVNDVMRIDIPIPTPPPEPLPQLEPMPLPPPPPAPATQVLAETLKTEKSLTENQIVTVLNSFESPSSSSISSNSSNSSTSTGPGSRRGRGRGRGRSRKRKGAAAMKKCLNNVNSPTPRPDSSNSIKNGTITPTPTLPNSTKQQLKTKKKTTFPCEICWFGKSFPTQKALDLHNMNKHSSNVRELVSCQCGMKVKKQSLTFHQQRCTTYKTTISR